MSDNPEESHGSLQDNPQAREVIQKHIDSQFTRIIQIGNMRFGEGQSQPPPPVPTQPSELPPDLQISYPETIPLEQARQTAPFKFDLPRWVPEGFVVEPTVQFSTTPANVWVHLMWAHPDSRRFGLDIQQRTTAPNFFSGPLPVEPNGVVEVSLDGHPAALLTHRKLFLAHSGETFISDDPELLWQHGGLDYQLRTWKKSLTTDELVRIAASLL